MLNKLDDIAILVGRSLLGLYFLGPGIAKVFDYTNYVAIMQANEVPLTLVALPIVILIQVIGGIMLILNQNVKVSALSLFCLLYTSPSPRDAHESRMPSSA